MILASLATDGGGGSWVYPELATGPVLAHCSMGGPKSRMVEVKLLDHSSKLSGGQSMSKLPARSGSFITGPGLVVGEQL